jgi:isopenicillin-N N-acyltransferase-like protein
MVGCAGVNADGVGVVINHLHMQDARPGVAFTFAVRRALQARRAADAANTLLASEPASGIHYLVGDEHGICGVETAATRSEVIAPRDGWLAHANHCAAPALRAFEVEPSVYSLCRGNRAEELLREHAGQIDASTLKAIACDHVGADDTICSHVEPGAPRLRQYKTDFAVVLDLCARAMELMVGSPCQGKSVKLKA